MEAIPDEFGFPPQCPTCDGPWMGWGKGSVALTAILVCDQWHHLQKEVSAEQLIRWELAMEPESLLDKPIYLAGSNEPVNPEWRLPAKMCRIGMGVSLDRDHFRVVAVEIDRVIVEPSPDQ